MAICARRLLKLCAKTMMSAIFYSMKILQGRSRRSSISLRQKDSSLLQKRVEVKFTLKLPQRHSGMKNSQGFFAGVTEVHCKELYYWDIVAKKNPQIGRLRVLIPVCYTDRLKSTYIIAHRINKRNSRVCYV